MRVYLDNNLVTSILNIEQSKVPANSVTQQEMESLSALAQMSHVEFLVSEEALAEIQRLPDESTKRQHLERTYHKLKGASVIRNSAVMYDDPIATYDSPDVFYNHPYTDADLNAVRALLRSKGNQNEFDARYIANAMLPANKIDVFLTADKRSLWNHRQDIKARFGVSVKLPSEFVGDLA